jgi:hypothetical protein
VEHWVHAVREEAGASWVWRIIESNGSPCRQWLPSEPPEDQPLDRGGFDSYRGALEFGLGICWVRASGGLLGQLTTEDVDRARRTIEDLPSRSVEGSPLYRWVVAA